LLTRFSPRLGSLAAWTDLLVPIRVFGKWFRVLYTIKLGITQFAKRNPHSTA
jgi:hypothetical protein